MNTEDFPSLPNSQAVPITSTNVEEHDEYDNHRLFLSWAPETGQYFMSRNSARLYTKRTGHTVIDANTGSGTCLRDAIKANLEDDRKRTIYQCDGCIVPEKTVREYEKQLESDDNKKLDKKHYISHVIQMGPSTAQQNYKKPFIAKGWWRLNRETGESEFVRFAGLNDVADDEGDTAGDDRNELDDVWSDTEDEDES